jgi:2'-hydroxyisoflavone reductase
VARLLEGKTAADIAVIVNILIIGGTIFLGRRLVESALARGHRVTTFTRGVHDIDLDVERLRGDRNADVRALEGRHWDAVIDTCGYVPGGVKRVMNALDRDRVGHYTFVSSVSVYDDMPPGGLDESAPVSRITPEQMKAAEEMATGIRATARTYGEMYGALKALCEQAAQDAMPGRVLNVRPGLIVGAYDYSDRFTYWTRRIAQGGRVLTPGRPQRRVRVIDARDLAEWMVRMAESGRTGVFNATGAEDGLIFSEMLETCRVATASDARLVWIDEEWLLAHGVQPWSELPLWVPEARNGIFEVRNDRAVEAGLTFRALSDTVRDTLQWDAGRPQDAPMRAGLTHGREQDLLAAHDASNSSR